MDANELYTKEEAEELRHIYSCWLNKAAHAGNGCIDILTSIAVKQKRIPKAQVKNNKKYTVEFEFAHAKKINAVSFLSNNGIVPSSRTKLNINTPHSTHTPVS